LVSCLRPFQPRNKPAFSIRQRDLVSVDFCPGPLFKLGNCLCSNFLTLCCGRQFECVIASKLDVTLVKVGFSLLVKGTESFIFLRVQC
jgi:hypothetical protein